ncbi:MAG: SDR family oxidoreductase [Rhizobiaceae bacterium]|nr:MAG: SDR family oxidoreductase [Rhizobiaceae bacterium]
MTESWFLFGAGYSARAFARHMDGKARIAGTTRAVEKFPLLRGFGIEPYRFDGKRTSDEVALALARTSHLVVSAAPDDEGDPVLNAAHSHLMTGTPALQWVGYLSTVGVYGFHDGAWVDEESECSPTSKRSRQRLDAEEVWLAFGRERGVPVAILRLAGIYGPGRNGFVNLERGTARRIVKPGQYFNRIHVDDIAGSIEFLAARRTGGIFNISDDEPAPASDVVAFAAKLMGVEAPPEIRFEDAELTPMARSFYGDNKKVSNRRIRTAGYRFAYPDYRTAFTRMWNEESWR